MALGNGDILRVSYESLDGGGILFVNTFHYRLEGDSSFIGNEPTIAGALTEVSNKLTAAYRGCIDASRTVQRLVGRTEVETWNGEVASAGELAINLAGLLASGDNLMPKALCGVIDRKTDIASRNSRGWIMVPGPRGSTNMNTNGAFNTGGSYYGSMVALASLLDDAIQHTVLAVNAWHLTPIIYSRTRRKRAQTPYYFEVKSANPRIDARWLNRRRTAP